MRRVGAAALTPQVWAALPVMLVAGLLAWAFHLNSPQPFIPYHDTWEYVSRAEIMLAGGPWVDPIRLPGYPLLLAVVFAVAGNGNLNAAEVTQGLLFIITAVEVYALTWRIWHSVRLALLVGLLFAINIYFFAFFRALLSDGLGAALVLALALAVVAFLERPGVWRFWVVAALCYATLMTRGEWVGAPLVIFPFLLLVAWRRGLARRLVAHMGAALTLIYGAVVGYMALNWKLNGYFGMTDATNINLYGKVTQYGMQGQAPARFLGVTAVTEAFKRRGLIDPWSIYWRDHALGGRHFAEMGAYAQAIILRHPLEFVYHSIPLAYISLSDAYIFGGYERMGRFAATLSQAQAFSGLVFPLFMLFPLCALSWLIVMARQWRRAGRWTGWQGRPTRAGKVGAALLEAETLVALSLLSLYALAMTTLTTYSEYGRLHLAFDPLMLIIVIGSAVALFGARRGDERPSAVRTRRASVHRATRRPARRSDLQRRPVAR